MLKISLINMPFADLWFPSIALTQLKHVLEERFGQDVRVRILYLNQEIAQYLGVRLYCYISNSLETNMAALGDWLFRDLAFPGLEENVQSYFQRCFPGKDAATLSKKQTILRKRKGLAIYLDRLIAKYSLDNEDVVGFTSMFCQNGASFAMARRLKDRNPNVIVAVGGANCEAPMGYELVRHVPQLDYVFSGPGLISFPQFVATCLSGRPSAEGIQGVFSKENSVDDPVSGVQALGEELPIDHYVPLNYQPFLDTLASNFAASEISPVLTFETSRGCWWGQKAHCTFCGLNGGTMAYRAMSPDKAITMFNDLFQYAPACTMFNAVDNILPKNYLKDVMPHIDPPENVALFYEVKADLSRADIEILARAHVKRIQPGIESLNTSTLKLMRKGTTAFQNLILLKNCQACGVQPEWNLLIGFPGEPESVFKKYVAVLQRFYHLPPPSDAFHVRFDRYSPYFVDAEKYGLDLHPSDFYSFIYPFDKHVLHNMAYYFSDHNYGAEYIASVSAWSAAVRGQIANWRSRWQDRSFRPALEWREKGDEHLVYDSRSGTAIEHRVDQNTKLLLQHLQRARSLTDIQRTFGDFDSLAALKDLEEKGLVFEEENRYLSLIIEDATAQATEPVVIEHLASESPGQGLLRVLA